MFFNRRGTLKVWQKGEWSKGKAKCKKPPAEKGEIVSISTDKGYVIAIGNGKKDPNEWPAVLLDKTLKEVLAGGGGGKTTVAHKASGGSTGH